MGWNSWIVFDGMATERDLREAAAVLVDDYLPSGYDTVVLDGGWMFPEGGGEARMDENGRYWPDPGRFPSCRDGFRSLSDEFRSMGLRFGLHVMRGVPRVAVDQRCPVLGTDVTCADIANQEDTCSWSDMMFGVRPEAPGAQDWYDSSFRLLAEWGVDFLKVDDISSPYRQAEIELVSSAIERCGRPMVVSLSPGNRTPVERASHVSQHAHLWRVSADFWDDWQDLRTAFDLMARWSPFGGEDAWPDADMIPFGLISIHGMERGLGVRWTRFSSAEQRTLFTLWCIARSPLMLGGHLSTMPGDTRKLVTDPLLLALNQRGEQPREVGRQGDLVAWRSRLDGKEVWAWFNVGEEPIDVDLGDWTERLAPATISIAPHDCALVQES